MHIKERELLNDIRKYNNDIQDLARRLGYIKNHAKRLQYISYIKTLANHIQCFAINLEERFKNDMGATNKVHH